MESPFRASQGDETGEVPTEVRKALASADLLRITIGEQWGGLGLGDVEASIVLEEMAAGGRTGSLGWRDA